MKKQLLTITALLLVVIIGLSSCMVSYHPAFAPGHYNHKPQHAPRHIEKHGHGNPHHDAAVTKPEFIEKNNVDQTIVGDEIFTASLDELITPVITPLIPITISTSPFTNNKIDTKQVVKSNDEIISTDKKASVIPNENDSKPKSKKENSNSAVTNDHGSNQLICAVVAFFIPPLGVILY